MALSAAVQASDSVTRRPSQGDTALGIVWRVVHAWDQLLLKERVRIAPTGGLDGSGKAGVGEWYELGNNSIVPVQVAVVMALEILVVGGGAGYINNSSSNSARNKNNRRENTTVSAESSVGYVVVGLGAHGWGDTGVEAPPPQEEPNAEGEEEAPEQSEGEAVGEPERVYTYNGLHDKVAEEMVKRNFLPVAVV